MLNKKEIAESKECLNNTIQNTYAEGKAIKLDNLRKYIEELENKVKKKQEEIDRLTDLSINLNKTIDDLKSIAGVALKRGPIEISKKTYELKSAIKIEQAYNIMNDSFVFRAK